MFKPISTELAIPNLRDICQGMISAYGTDRDIARSDVRRDYDWQSNDLDGSPLTLRLIQQGLGEAALFTLRVNEADSASDQVSTYTYSLNSGVLHHVVRVDKSNHGPLQLPDNVIIPLLWTGVPNPHQ